MSTTIRTQGDDHPPQNEHDVDNGQHNNEEEEDHIVNDNESEQQPQRTNIPSLTCAFLASLTTGGTTYAFGLYGDAMKKTLHLSQPELDTISTAFFFAGLFSWVPGMIVDRFGTRMGLVAGGIQAALSLCSYWAVATQFMVVDRALIVPSLSILGVLIFLSSALITGSVFKIIVSTCGPGSKGTAVGAAKGYVGLGAGAYACLFEALRTSNESDLDFLPMAAFFAVFVVVLPSLCLLPSNDEVLRQPVRDESTPLHFRILFASLLAMATLIMGSSLAELAEGDSKGSSSSGKETPNFPVAIFLVTVWIGPILGLQLVPHRTNMEAANSTDVAVQEGESLLRDSGGEISMRQLHNDRHQDVDRECGENSASSLGLDQGIAGNTPKFLRLPDGDDHNDDDVDGSGSIGLHHRLSLSQRCMDEFSDEGNPGHDDVADFNDEADNKNLCQMLNTNTARLMLFTTTVLVGGGIVETNNMGQMVEALNFPHDTTSASLAFFSVAQSFGRVVTGAISESALNWPTHSFCIDHGIPRPFFLVTASLAGFLAHLLLAFAKHKGVFVLGATLSGFAFGMCWPLMVLITGEVFGTQNVGANYMFFDGFTSAAGSLILSKLVAQEVYEDNIDRKDNPDNLTCIGSRCFQMTHLIVSGLSLVCVLTSLGMLYTTRKIYNSDRLHKN